MRWVRPARRASLMGLRLFEERRLRSRHDPREIGVDADAVLANALALGLLALLAGGVLLSLLFLLRALADALLLGGFVRFRQWSTSSCGATVRSHALGPPRPEGDGDVVKKLGEIAAPLGSRPDDPRSLAISRERGTWARA